MEKHPSIKVEKELYVDSGVKACLFLPKINRVVSSSYKTIHISNPKTGKCERELIGHSSFIEALAIFNHTYLLSGGEDTKIVLWNYRTWEMSQVFEGHEGFISNIMRISKYSFISSDRCGEMKVWNIRGKELLSLKDEDCQSLHCLCMLKSDKNIFISGGRYSRNSSNKFIIKKYQIQPTFEEIVEFEIFHDHKISCIVSFIEKESDNEIIISLGEDKRIVFWDLEGQVIRELDGVLSPLKKGILMCSDTYLVTCDWNGYVSLFNTKTFQKVSEKKVHQSIINTMTFLSSKRRFLTGSLDKTVKICKLRNVLNGSCTSLDDLESLDRLNPSPSPSPLPLSFYNGNNNNNNNNSNNNSNSSSNIFHVITHSPRKKKQKTKQQDHHHHHHHHHHFFQEQQPEQSQSQQQTTEGTPKKRRRSKKKKKKTFEVPEKRSFIRGDEENSSSQEKSPSSSTNKKNESTEEKEESNEENEISEEMFLQNIDEECVTPKEDSVPQYTTKSNSRRSSTTSSRTPSPSSPSLQREEYSNYNTDDSDSDGDSDEIEALREQLASQKRKFSELKSEIQQRVNEQQLKFQKELQKWKLKYHRIADEHQTLLINLQNERWKGTRIDKNCITKGSYIASGGFGKVYSGIWKIRREIAIKEVPLNLKTNSDENDVFKELEDAIGLIHPSVLRTYGFYQPTHDSICLVMEKMDYDILKYLRKKKLSLYEKFKLMVKMNEGVHFLHSKNMIHRDIKSMNFLVRGEGRDVKICDFGLSRSCETTFVSEQRGTVRWMAPELLNVDAEYSVFSDVYALGITYYEVLFERIPYQHISNDYVVMKEVETNNLRPDISDPKLPIEFKLFLEKMWDKKPKKRPTTEGITLWFKSMHSQAKKMFSNYYFPKNRSSKRINTD